MYEVAVGLALWAHSGSLAAIKGMETLARKDSVSPAKEPR